jgi:hypothetical protein
MLSHRRISPKQLRSLGWEPDGPLFRRCYTLTPVRARAMVIIIARTTDSYNKSVPGRWV